MAYLGSRRIPQELADTALRLWHLAGVVSRYYADAAAAEKATKTGKTALVRTPAATVYFAAHSAWSLCCKELRTRVYRHIAHEGGSIELLPPRKPCPGEPDALLVAALFEASEATSRLLEAGGNPAGSHLPAKLREIAAAISPEAASPKPLAPAAALVYEHLLTLPAHRGLTGTQLRRYLEGLEPPIFLDGPTFHGRIVPELHRWGVRNVRRIGYFVAPEFRPEFAQCAMDAQLSEPTGTCNDQPDVSTPASQSRRDGPRGKRAAAVA